MKALIFSLLFFYYGDPEPNRSQTAVMEVKIDILSGSVPMGAIGQSVLSNNLDEQFQIGYKEILISFPAETEILTHSGSYPFQSTQCSCYMTADHEIIDPQTSKLVIHYIVTKNHNARSNSAPIQTATIFYL